MTNYAIETPDGQGVDVLKFPQVMPALDAVEAWTMLSNAAA